MGGQTLRLLLQKCCQPNGTDIQPRRRFLDFSSAAGTVALLEARKRRATKRAASAAMLSWTAIRLRHEASRLPLRNRR